jgi:hypothetical protein
MSRLPHPISRLDTYDTVVTTGRGGYLGLVIAGPLRDDEVSRARLKKKIGLYLGYFQSPRYLDRYAAPSLDRSRIYISIHAGSAVYAETGGKLWRAFPRVWNHVSHQDQQRRSAVARGTAAALRRI